MSRARGAGATLIRDDSGVSPFTGCRLLLRCPREICRLPPRSACVLLCGLRHPRDTSLALFASEGERSVHEVSQRGRQAARDEDDRDRRLGSAPRSRRACGACRADGDPVAIRASREAYGRRPGRSAKSEQLPLPQHHARGGLLRLTRNVFERGLGRDQ